MQRIARFSLCAAGMLCLAAWAMYRLLDQRAASWCAAHTLGLDSAWWFVVSKQLGKFWLQACLVVGCSLLGGGKRVLLAGLIAIMLAGVTADSVKVFARRTRPPEALGLKDQEVHGLLYSSSFPSADASTTFALAVAVGSLVSVPWRIAFFALATGVSVGRVLTLHHYPSDVAAGAALGLVCGLGALIACERLSRSPPKWLRFLAEASQRDQATGA